MLLYEIIRRGKRNSTTEDAEEQGRARLNHQGHEGARRKTKGQSRALAFVVLREN